MSQEQLHCHLWCNQHTSRAVFWGKGTIIQNFIIIMPIMGSLQKVRKWTRNGDVISIHFISETTYMKLKLNLTFLKNISLHKKTGTGHKIEMSSRSTIYIWNIFQYTVYLMNTRKNNSWFCAVYICSNWVFNNRFVSIIIEHHGQNSKKCMWEICVLHEYFSTHVV